MSIKEKIAELERKTDTIVPEPIKKGSVFWDRIKELRSPLKLSRKEIREGKILCLIWNENNAVELRKIRVDGQVIRLTDLTGSTYHSITPEDIGLFNGRFPMVHINKWSSQAYSPGMEKKRAEKYTSFVPAEDYKESEKEGTRTYGQKLIMARMLSDQIKEKSTFSAKWILWGLLILGVLYYVATNFAK